MSKRSRPKPRVEPVLGPEHGPTFAEVIERMGLIEKTSGLTRELIADINTAAAEHARVTLSVVSCYTCDAPKACCSLLTSAYLYEVVPIAARLIREGRDTPELRAQGRVRAAGRKHARTMRAGASASCGRRSRICCASSGRTASALPCRGSASTRASVQAA